MTKISVIIPVYNTKDYLEEAINSLIVQKNYLHEIIIINDGSTDGSGNLLDDLYGGLSYIKIIHSKNYGQGHARNLGTELAEGDFIYYFDSDDISSNGVFQKFHELINKDSNLELLCFSGESFVDSHYSKAEHQKNYLMSKDAYKRNLNRIFESGQDAFVSLLNNKGYYASPPLYIFRKSLLQEHNLKFTSQKYEDESFTHQLFLYAGRTKVINDVYFQRRIRKGSTMQTKRNFNNIIGYIYTVENLSALEELDFLKSETKEKIIHRRKRFIKEIIIMYVHLREKINEAGHLTIKDFFRNYISGDLKYFYWKLLIKNKLRQIRTGKV